MSREEIQKQFGLHATDYVSSPTHAKGRSLSRLLDILPWSPDWISLDIATGAGHTAFAIAPLVGHVLATDITPAMLELTRDGAAERGFANITVDTADAERLPYEDGSFDLVTCRIAAHHFGDIPVFLSEARRVLRRGGRLVVIDNIVPSGAAGAYVNAFEKLRDPSHNRCLELPEWLAAFAAAGLEPEHQETLGKRVNFTTWAARHDPVMQAYLRAMLSEITGEAARFLAPQLDEEPASFGLLEAIIVGRAHGRK
jgi:SAM-dependent methyltransferase